MSLIIFIYWILTYINISFVNTYKCLLNLRLYIFGSMDFISKTHAFISIKHNIIFNNKILSTFEVEQWNIVKIFYVIN